MKDYKLKPCPFCGKEPRISSEYYEELKEKNGSAMVEIKCDCGASLSIHSFQYQEEEQGLKSMTDKLVEKWNKRPIEEDISRSNEDLYDEIRELEESLKTVGEEAHEYLRKWTKTLKQNEILNRVIIMNEVSRTCPELASEYRQEAEK